MPKTDDLDLDALEAVADGATPGEWELGTNPRSVYARGVCHLCVAVNRAELNAAHIAAFDPPTVKALIAEIRRLRALVEEGRRDSLYWRGRWCDLG